MCDVMSSLMYKMMSYLLWLMSQSKAWGCSDVCTGELF